jgi:hypothetical protein
MRKQLNAKKQAQCFKLSPTKSMNYVSVKLDDAVKERTLLKGAGMNQLPINMNNVLTEHKFQGMSKDKFIVFLSSFMPN